MNETKDEGISAFVFGPSSLVLGPRLFEDTRMCNFISSRVQSVPPSGIRRFFDIAATMKDVVSLGIGEPDFVTPAPILQAGIASLQRGQTAYTSNSGLIELRQAIARSLAGRYAGVKWYPADIVNYLQSTMTL